MTSSHSLAKELMKAEKDQRSTEKQFGPNHPAVAAALNNVAALHDSAGNFAAAEPMYKRAVAILEKLQGPSSSDLAVLLSNLASHYDDAAQPARALPIHQRAVAMAGACAEEMEYEDIIHCLAHLASHHLEQRQYAEALEVHHRMIAAAQAEQGPDGEDLAEWTSGIGFIQHEMGDFAGAAQSFGEALRIETLLNGPDHPNVAVALNNLAQVEARFGKRAEAEQHLRQAITILRNGAPADERLPEIEGCLARLLAQ